MISNFQFSKKKLSHTWPTYTDFYFDQIIYLRGFRNLFKSPQCIIYQHIIYMSSRLLYRPFFTFNIEYENLWAALEMIEFAGKYYIKFNYEYNSSNATVVFERKTYPYHKRIFLEKYKLIAGIGKFNA